MATQLTLKVPFQIGPTGGVESIIDPVTLAAQEIKTVLLTLQGERLMRPSIGSPFNLQLFTPLDTSEIELQTDLVLDALQRQCVLSRIEHAVFTPNSNEGALSFDVAFTAVGAFQNNVVNVTLQ